MLSQNKSKAITRIFLFFFPLPLLSTLFCLDLIYQNQYFKRKKESISSIIAIFFGLLAYSEFASRHSNFNFGLPYDFFLDYPFWWIIHGKWIIHEKWIIQNGGLSKKMDEMSLPLPWHERPKVWRQCISLARTA